MATPAAASADPLYYERISLLWPEGTPARPGPGLGLPPTAQGDLDLIDIVEALSNGEERRERFVRSLLADLCTDAAVIRYRQDVLADLLDDDPLCERLRAVLRPLVDLARQRAHNPRDTWSLLRITERLAHLELYVDVALQLHAALAGATPRSAGLRWLSGHLAEVTQSEQFRSMQEELPRLRAHLDEAGSVTIGLNLSRDLMPESATIMRISSAKIEGRGTLLERLFGGDQGRRGITPLRAADAANIYSAENRLFRDLRKLLEAVAAPVGQALDRYTGVHAHALELLEPELHFLLSAAALIRRLRAAGLPICRPVIASADERTTVLADAYNLGLALRTLREAEKAASQPPAVVTNAITFDQASARIWILTGPNRGGKTTYTRAIGQAHLLAQAGLWAPANAARLSPVDAIFTHFPSKESDQLGMGRLDEEADRLAGIFAAATPHSLILLNEVLAGTSAVEALGLALDAVRGLCLLGARAIYTTHLHELAKSVAEINASTPGRSTAGSLVAGVEGEGAIVERGHRRTYNISPGPPRGVSYASEIAEQHGISYAQLERLLRERGLLAPEPAAPAE